MYAQLNPIYFYLNQRSHVVSLNLYMGPINMYRNEDIHLKIGETPIDKRMRKSIEMVWHVQRREIKEPTRKSELIRV